MLDSVRQANLGQPGIVMDERGDPEGADPRTMSAEALEEIGHLPRSLRKVIRAKCLECCCGSVSEVRACIITSCPLWPYRMASNPFRKISEAKREQGRRLAAMRVADHG